MNDDRARVAAKLREQLVELRELETKATDGDEEVLAELRERIAATEATISMLVARVETIAAQSYRFEVTRDSDGLMIEIIATPIN